MHSRIRYENLFRLIFRDFSTREHIYPWQQGIWGAPAPLPCVDGGWWINGSKLPHSRVFKLHSRIRYENLFHLIFRDFSAQEYMYPWQLGFLGAPAPLPCVDGSWWINGSKLPHSRMFRWHSRIRYENLFRLIFQDFSNREHIYSWQLGISGAPAPLPCVDGGS